MMHLARAFAAFSGIVALICVTGPVGAASVAAGKVKFAVCAGCHGPTGAGNPSLNYPRLAGRDASFVAAQLRAFQSGARDNPTMKVMAAGLTDADIDNLAAYIATLK